ALLGREEVLALLLDENAAEQRPEQPHIAAQGAVMTVGAQRVFHRLHLRRSPRLARAGNYASVSRSRSRPSARCLRMTESISQPAALRAPGPRAPALRRREIHRWLVAGGLWIFFFGNLAAILYITLFSSSGDALNYHWSSFDSVLIGLGRLTA